METVDSIVKALKKGEWLASLDLKDAYMHVSVLPAHGPYMRFAFRNLHYQFKVLPFGLTTAPRVFTTILAPVVSLIHRQGIRFHPYLDDCLIIAKTQDHLTSHVQIALSILQEVVWAS